MLLRAFVPLIFTSAVTALIVQQSPGEDETSWLSQLTDEQRTSAGLSKLSTSELEYLRVHVSGLITNAKSAYLEGSLEELNTRKVLLEARIEKLQPNDEGLTPMQASDALDQMASLGMQAGMFEQGEVASGEWIGIAMSTGLFWTTETQWNSNQLTIGSRAFWNSYQLQQGTKAFWNSYQHKLGTKAFWNSYQHKLGTKAFWNSYQHKLGTKAFWNSYQLKQGTKAFWSQGKGPGSAHYWLRGTK